MSVSPLLVQEECAIPHDPRFAVFRRQVLQRLPLPLMQWPTKALLQDYEIQKVIFEIVRDAWIVLQSGIERPSSVSRWERDLWAQLGARVEEAVLDSPEGDVYDSLMECCALYQNIPIAVAAGGAQDDALLAYRAAALDDPGQDLVSIELLEKPGVLAGSGSTGHRTWEAALALSTIIVEDWLPQGKLKDKRVLELGAGTGLCSFLCATTHNPHHCADCVVITDGDSRIVDRLLSNRQENKHRMIDRVSIGLYLWGEPFEGSVVGDALSEGPFDIVIGSDVTYDPSIIPSLVETLKMLFRHNSETLCIIAATARNLDTLNSFTSACDGNALDVVIVEHPVRPMASQTHLFHPNSDTIRILQISPKTT